MYQYINTRIDQLIATLKQEQEQKIANDTQKHLNLFSKEFSEDVHQVEKSQWNVKDSIS